MDNFEMGMKVTQKEKIQDEMVSCWGVGKLTVNFDPCF
jgi:hypothetical protein